MKKLQVTDDRRMETRLCGSCRAWTRVPAGAWPDFEYVTCDDCRQLEIKRAEALDFQS